MARGDLRVSDAIVIPAAELAVTFVRGDGSGTRTDIAAKGAPEAILSLCSVNDQDQHAILERTGEMAAELWTRRFAIEKCRLTN